jgi:hypothetical protein
LILFELVYPVRTGMEKHERFSEMRKGILPDNLMGKYNGIARLILQMTDSDMTKRPCIKTVLKSIGNEILKLESNNIGLGISEVLTQRNRFYSFDERDKINEELYANFTVEKNFNICDDSYTLRLIVDAEGESENNTKLLNL